MIPLPFFISVVSFVPASVRPGSGGFDSFYLNKNFRGRKRKYFNFSTVPKSFCAIFSAVFSAVPKKKSKYSPCLIFYPEPLFSLIFFSQSLSFRCLCRNSLFFLHHRCIRLCRPAKHSNIFHREIILIMV